MKGSAAVLLIAVLGASCMLAAANEPATWAVAHCDCTRERAIVCGADGTSYLNKCWAECSGTTVEHEGRCGPLVAEVSGCDCTKERALVCGADGHTYLNKCWAECIAGGVQYEGACQKVAEVSSCDCTKERALVCGADGHTYLNKCWAECIAGGVVYEGACQKASEVTADATACDCTKERALVCGADGHTYLNKCWAECIAGGVKYEGACQKAAEVTADVSGCDCTKERALVCGADGHTYLNKCWAECIAGGVKYEGACQKAADVSACGCPKERALVCGADGHTYLNECWAECTGTTVVHQGPCGRAVENPACSCTNERNLVCGEDGHTYLNACWALCSSTSVAYEGSCQKITLEAATLGSTECQKGCPVIFDPVCGMNNKSYASKCRMECDGVELKHEGRCSKKVPVEAAASCRDACPRGWSSPICGSDGVTYTSECLAMCAGADFAKLGFCEKCDASDDYKPVCDNQGFTWLNAGWMKCAKAEFGHDGECEGTQSILGSTECQKACPRVFEPVCGMNNKSYANKCRMECDGVELKHEGRCPIESLVKEAVSGSCEDSCDKSGMAHGVCGRDGKTYPSECAAECAGVSILRPLPCQMCPVPQIYMPVCDTRGYTWINRWAMACGGGELAHDGACSKADQSAVKEAVSESCDDSCDKRPFVEPVCGSDDKTYPGRCAADCARIAVVKGGTCKFCPTPHAILPVCDTQGYTWINPWQLECAGAEKAHDGVCEPYLSQSEVREAVSGSCEDGCDKSGMARPVCGSDDKNYPGECAAKCAGVEVVKYDTCKFCPIPRIYAPVCDTKGYTWVNEWLLQCAGAEKAHDGPCGESATQVV